MVRRKKSQDPHFKREAGKYENPIASREFIMKLLEDCGSPRTAKQIGADLNIESEEDTEALRRRLRAMERDGQLLRNRRNGYGLTSKMDLVCGRVIGHPDGFGFLVPDEGGDDLFLSGRQMRTLFHGDRITAQVMGVDRRGRREGALVDVLERNTHQIVGKYFFENGIGVVVSDNKRINQDILIPEAESNDAKDGEIVVAAIIEPPTQRKQAVGRIVEILGEHMAPGMEMEISIRNYELPHQWPDAVVKETAAYTEEVPEVAKQGREDLRNTPLVTIDGEDARDFDDAVFCQRDGDGWKLLVAIADVSAYVQPGSPLDGEAELRGNSVYFPQNVIPMLPEVLSNGLCSLKPKVDRLCMVCELHFSAAGEIENSKFFEAVMHSHARLTYDRVAAVLDGDSADFQNEYPGLLPHLQDLHALYEVLKVARKKRGAIDFDRTETRIVFGEERKISEIVPVVRNDAHKMIEEFMISANIAAAEFLEKKKMPLVFRVHQEPMKDKLADVHSFMAELGLHLAGGDSPQAGDYRQLISSVSERPDRHLIETVLLRSLSQAQYSPENCGHFGLALPQYAHFTSPIRRYADLLVHRAIRHVLRGGKPGEFFYTHADMQGMGEHISMTDRRADEATRDAVDWLKCEYMLDKVGERFDGVITTVTGFGLFIELNKVYVEGLLHVTELENDYYHFDPVKHRMLGERSGKTYRIGDGISVIVAQVNLDERKIDFVMKKKDETGKAGKSSKSSKSGKPNTKNKSSDSAKAEKKTSKKKTKKRRKSKSPEKKS